MEVTPCAIGGTSRRQIPDMGQLLINLLPSLVRRPGQLRMSESRSSAPYEPTSHPGHLLAFRRGNRGNTERIGRRRQFHLLSRVALHSNPCRFSQCHKHGCVVARVGGQHPRLLKAVERAGARVGSPHLDQHRRRLGGSTPFAAHSAAYFSAPRPLATARGNAIVRFRQFDPFTRRQDSDC